MSFPLNLCLLRFDRIICIIQFFAKVNNFVLIKLINANLTIKGEGISPQGVLNQQSASLHICFGNFIVNKRMMPMEIIWITTNFSMARSVFCVFSGLLEIGLFFWFFTGRREDGFRYFYQKWYFSPPNRFFRTSKKVSIFELQQ